MLKEEVCSIDCFCETHFRSRTGLQGLVWAARRHGIEQLASDFEIHELRAID